MKIRGDTKQVWQFTNQRGLTAPEFISYIERKVFKTIRKFDMLPANKIITLKQSQSLNTKILKQILEKKFTVKFASSKPNFSLDNLSQIAEDNFKNILEGKLKNKLPTNAPLFYHSDKELELYAKLKKISGTKRKQDKKVQSLFEKFLKKNQDLELNVVKALSQVN
jgi:hypothetical protein